jgi:hypothetical protein
MTSTGVKRSLYGFIENPGVMYGAALLALAIYIYACVCEG